MSEHKALLERVAERAAALPPPSAADGVTPPRTGAGAFAGGAEPDRALLVQFLLHAADLSNPLLPPADSQRIAAFLGQEFERQAGLETALGLPVSVQLAGDPAARAAIEVSFISCARLWGGGRGEGADSRPARPLTSRAAPVPPPSFAPTCAQRSRCAPRSRCWPRWCPLWTCAWIWWTATCGRGARSRPGARALRGARDRWLARAGRGWGGVGVGGVVGW